MDYGEILRGAWRVAWRHKYLWLLGALSAEGASCGGGGDGGSYQFSDGNVSVGSFAGAGDWIAGHLWVIGVLILGLFAAGLVLLILSVASTAGLVAGTDRAARYEAGTALSNDSAASTPTGGLRDAWRAGLGSFWRLLGLWVLVGVGVVALLAAAWGGFGLGIYAAARAGSPAVEIVLLLVLIGLLLLVCTVVALITLQIVLSWAVRSLVLTGTGVPASLGRGWHLFRHNLGHSIVLWVIQTAITIASGIAVIGGLVALALPAVLVATPLVRAGGPLPWGLLALGGLAVLVLLLVVRGALGTFLSAYWTIAYRRLEALPGAAAPALAPPAAGTPSGAASPPRSPG